MRKGMSKRDNEGIMRWTEKIEELMMSRGKKRRIENTEELGKFNIISSCKSLFHSIFHSFVINTMDPELVWIQSIPSLHTPE